LQTLLKILGLGIVCLLFAASPATSATIEHIVNGDFESGDFTGWTNLATGYGLGFSINDGTFDPNGPGGPSAPIAGSYDAVSSQFGPGLNLISQSFVVPVDITLATISWDDRVENFGFGGFADPNQEFRVLVQDVVGTTLYEVFSTNPGDATSQPGPNSREFDLTGVLQGLSGMEIQVAFVQQDSIGFFNATVDNISVRTQTELGSGAAAMPEPGAATLFGLGALVVAWRTRRAR
jgi:hypothetical protein